MYRNVRVIAAALLWCVPMVLRSQEAASVVVGDRIRLLAPTLGAEEREGILGGLSRGQVLIKESKNGPILSVSAAQVTRLDVWRPGTETQAGKGALIGAIAGGVIFGVGGFYATKCPGSCSQGEYLSGAGALLAIPGSGVGALVGALVGRSEKRMGWQPVRLPLRVSATPESKRNFWWSGSVVF